jgi:hypothetical protein
MELHPLNTFERLQPAQKNPFADAYALTGYVEHEVVAINKINVRVSAFHKKRPVAWRHPAKRVTSRVAHEISFCLDDTSAKPHVRQIMHQRFADQKTRQFDGINRQLAAAEAANANFSAR